MNQWSDERDVETEAPYVRPFITEEGEMDLPESCRSLIREIVERHLDDDDLEEAKMESRAAIRAHPDFKSLIDILVDGATDRMVWQIRCELARHYKGKFQASKCSPGKDQSKPRKPRYDATRRILAQQSVFKVPIGATTVGNLYGHQLAEMADSLASQVRGHREIEILLRCFISKVPSNKRVHEVIPEKKANLLWEQAKEQVRRETEGRAKEAG